MVNEYYLSEQCKLKPQRNTSTYPSLAKIKKSKEFQWLVKMCINGNSYIPTVMKEIGTTTIEKQFGITY